MGRLGLPPLTQDEWLRGCVPPLPPLERYCVSAGGQSLQHCSNHGSSGSADVAFSLELPCTLRLGARAGGRLDLQLQLLTLQVGAAAGEGARRKHGLLEAANRAAALLVARALFPNALRPACQVLAGLWCASTAATAVTKVVCWRRSRSRAGPSLRASAPEAPWLRVARQGLSAAGRFVQKHGEPAAALALVAALWALLHPSSEQIGRCVAALVPVLSGYARTSRECAAGQYGEGPELEQAWHRRHKWAAQRLAPFLTPLAPTPPLKPLLDAWDALDISIALALPGEPSSGWGLGSWGGGGSSLRLAASVGVRPTRRRPAQRQQQWPHSQSQQQAAPGEALDPKSPAAAAPAAAEGPASGPLPPATPPQREGPRGGAHPSATSPSTRRTTPDSCRFTLEQMEQLRSYQEAARELFRTPTAERGLRAKEQHQQGHQHGQQGQEQGHPKENKGGPAGDGRAWKVAAWLGLASAACQHSAAAEATSRSSSSLSDMSSDGGSTWSGASSEGGSFGSIAAAVLLAEGAPVPEPTEGPGLVLYGRGDHSHRQGAQRSLTPLEFLQLGARAVQLLCVFAPFLLLSSVTLLLAACLPAQPAGVERADKPQQAADGSMGQAQQGTAKEPAVAAGRSEAQPPASQHPAVQRLRALALRQLLSACRRSGAALIKWGQWASTREDLFPEDLCRALSELHDRAPQHSYAHTRSMVEAAFGRPVEELFQEFDPTPLASGSVAQVHRAVMRVGGRRVAVAVKVRHPSVEKQIWQDFQLLRPLAALTGRVRSLKGLQLKDSVAQFSHSMTAQTDLRVEAVHLARFAANFAQVAGSVVIPSPVPGFCSESVLVESFEPGLSISQYLRSAHPRNAEVVALGVDAYLQMLLNDNFVHSDLHPGNILVRSSEGEGGREQLQIVLLDFGLAEELTPSVRTHFISLLNMIAKGDGRQAAAHLLQWAAHQRCPHPAAFAADVEALFRWECDIYAPAGINLDTVMKSILHLARKHEVTIDSSYAVLVVGICVLVGFAASLDPRVNLMDAATPALLFYALTGRMLGRLYM